jgi:predicted Rossmann fold nucleotide-binding protein DprA/Smf involved in DNA uptake
VCEPDATADTRATLLLCARLPGPDDRPRDPGAEPLRPGEYDRLALWLLGRGLRTGSLLDATFQSRLDESDAPVDSARLLALLARGDRLDRAVEGWALLGIWTLTRGARLYPQRLRGAGGAPPLLYGVGDPGLLARGGLAIVGSRSPDDEALEYTQRVALACAEQGICVVSGGARGVDRRAGVTALDSGGELVEVLAEGVAGRARDERRCGALESGHLAVVSAYHPGAGFSVGNAMGRNRQIYSLAPYALVVSASRGAGGTWTGACDALRRGVTPVFVRAQRNVPDGNRALLAEGSRPFPPEPWTDLEDSLRRHSTGRDGRS